MNTQEKTPKKTWRKPELCILVRHNSEEMVLTACKRSDQNAGPNNSFDNCQANTGMICQMCEILGTS